MDLKTKKLLEKIKIIDDKNQALYDKRADLKDEILAIDIELFKLMGEYNLTVKHF